MFGKITYGNNMARTFITFVLVTSAVMHSIIHLSSAASGGLPADGWTTLDQLQNNLNIVLSEKFAIIRTITNGLRNSTEKLISGQPLEPNSNTTGINAERQQRFRNAGENILLAITTATGKTCAGIKLYRSAVQANMDQVSKSIGDAIALTTTGKYPESESGINDFKSQTRAALIDLCANLYDLIDGCFDTDSRADVDSVLKISLNGAQTSSLLAADALYSTFELYAAVVSDKTSYTLVTALSRIDSNRDDAIVGVQGSLCYLFGAIEGLYLDRKLGRTKIVDCLYLSQYYQKLTIQQWTRAMAIVSTANAKSLEQVTGVKENGRLNYFPASLANQTEAQNALQKVQNYGLDSIQQTQPSSSSRVNALRQTSPGVNRLLTSGWFSAISLAQGKGLLCATIPAKIEIIDRAQVPIFTGVVSAVFLALSNNLTTASVLAPAMASSRANASDYAVAANGLIYEGSQYFSKTICANRGTNQADFVQIRNILDQALVAFLQFNNNVWRSNLIQVLANAGYY